MCRVSLCIPKNLNCKDDMMYQYSDKVKIARTGATAADGADLNGQEGSILKRKESEAPCGGSGDT